MWLNKNWNSKGCVNDNHLYVNHDKKSFCLAIEHTQDSTAIEVKTKKDLLNYIKILKNNGYLDKSKIRIL